MLPIPTNILLLVFTAFMLQILSKFPVAFAMGKSKGGYDNKTPRDQQASLKDWGKRSLAAHQNTFEAFPSFAIGVLFSLYSNVDPDVIFNFCLLFVVARILYVVLYIANIDMVRSLVWGLGYMATGALYLWPLLTR